MSEPSTDPDERTERRLTIADVVLLYRVVAQQMLAVVSSSGSVVDPRWRFVRAPTNCSPTPRRG